MLDFLLETISDAITPLLSWKAIALIVLVGTGFFLLCSR